MTFSRFAADEPSSEAAAAAAVKREPPSPPTSPMPSQMLQYQCGLCPYATSKAWQFKCHQAAVHVGEKPFACNLCPMTFDQKEDMLKHVEEHRMQHYQCKLCLKRFNKLQGLKLHERCHTFFKQAP
ncbi:hypothetical protein HPB52_001724 [Rhipicephalus sanguineus]|uniref:C2H2-type domain-containing protein n=1 Tax=Rhipicephalus sanguineus TaxID=34632 RepID=A0A9D4QCP9_RHISA|nr:hypothetical protein HPB52_001724 [Rhipicephalus sanguineus]